MITARRLSSGDAITNKTRAINSDHENCDKKSVYHGCMWQFCISLRKVSVLINNMKFVHMKCWHQEMKSWTLICLSSTNLQTTFQEKSKGFESLRNESEESVNITLKKNPGWMNKLELAHFRFLKSAFPLFL